MYVDTCPVSCFQGMKLIKSLDTDVPAATQETVEPATEQTNTDGDVASRADGSSSDTPSEKSEWLKSWYDRQDE